MGDDVNEVFSGRYELLRELASGGTATVYQAKHIVSQRTVALKILPPRVGMDAAARERFNREASAPAQIGHPAVVEVYDAGIDPETGSPYVAMEMLEGQTLRQRLRDGGLSPRGAPRHHLAGAGAAHRRPRQGLRAPRPQAREHLPRVLQGPSAAGAPARLRADAAPDLQADHGCQRDPGHAELHEPRTDPRPDRLRPLDRRLGRRRDPLRGAGGPAPLPLPGAQRGHRADRAGAARPRSESASQSSPTRSCTSSSSAW